MYVNTGMGSYRPRRRGLGAGSMVNGVYVTDTPITTDTVLGSGENVYTDASGAVIGTSSGGVTSWLNANAGTAAMVGGGFLFLMLFAKAGR